MGLMVAFEKRDPTVFHEGYVLNADGTLSCPNPAKYLNRTRANGRTLEMAAKAYAACMSLSNCTEEEAASYRSLLIEGAVGKDAALPFLEFCATASVIPAPEELLDNPDKYPISEMPPDLQYLAVSSAATHVRSQVVNHRATSGDTWAKGLVFFEKVYDSGMGDLATMGASLFLDKTVGVPTGAKIPPNTIAKLLPMMKDLRTFGA